MTLLVRDRLLYLAFAGLLAIFSLTDADNPGSFAADAPTRVGYPQPSGAMLPLWLVSEAKRDQKYGVPGQNIFISGARE